MEGGKNEEVAFWYPEPYWGSESTDVIKNLLPFFDSVAILLPKYMYGRHHRVAPWFTPALEEAGLLHVWEPETFVDVEVTNRLSTLVTSLVEAGAFDDLEGHPYFAELSMSRLGWNADVELAGGLTELLRSRGLAKESEDGVSVPLRSEVRTAILVTLAQLSRSRGRALGYDVHPVTGHRERVRDLAATMRLGPFMSVAQVVALDVETIGVDLSLVPFDEILAFRSEHGSPFRDYRRNLRDFLASVVDADESELDERLLDRQEELQDRASELRKMSRRFWRRPAARIGVGLVGAGMSVAAGQIAPAVVAGIAAMLEWEPSEKGTVGSYSYLFEVSGSLSR